MASSVIAISDLKFSNRTDSELSLVLEPEGDVIQVPSGKTCQIASYQESGPGLNCEVEFGSEGEVTVYLAITKQVYINGERVR